MSFVPIFTFVAFTVLVAFFAIYSIAFYGENFNTARLTVLVPLLAFPVLSIVYRNILSRMHDGLCSENSLCIIGSGMEARDVYRRVRAGGSTQEVFVVDTDSMMIGQRLLADDVESPVVGSLEGLDLNSSINGKFVESYIVAGEAKYLPMDFEKRLVGAHFSGNRIYTYQIGV